MGSSLITPPIRRVLANPLGFLMLLGAVGGYGLTSVLLKSSLGATARVLAVIPVFVAGWWLGWRAGLVTGLFILAGNLRRWSSRPPGRIETPSGERGKF
jgi:hypothetical protein